MPRPTLRLLANPTSSTLPLKRPGGRRGAPPMTLLPPIPLYRRLLRLHRQKLNSEEKVFGDTYIKSEWRRHRDIENPLHIVGFLSQWQMYGDMISRKPAEGTGDVGDIDGKSWMQGTEEWAMEGLLEKMNDQQVGQVWELYNAIQRRNEGGGVEEDGGGSGEVEDGVTHLDGK